MAAIFCLGCYKGPPNSCMQVRILILMGNKDIFLCPSSIQLERLHETETGQG